MPPRIRGSSCQPQLLLNYLEPVPSSSISPASALTPLHRPTASPSPKCSRAFSTTPAPQITKLRRAFKEWCADKGLMYRNAPYDQTNYMGFSRTRPFPENEHFKSEPVLSVRARNMIWEAIMVKGMPLKAVSAEFHVDMRRVAAVVRMMEIEKKWEREDKPLAHAYARAITAMLPRADLLEGENKFEPINDIHVHSYTTQQLFVPASESRQFTRADAAKAFGEHILPPDAKMRIPELVQMERNLVEGMEPREARGRFIKEAAESEQAFAERQRERALAAEERKTRVNTGRFEFRFEKINAENVGPTGRARKAAGWRYGAPHMDRRRGEVKIPTSVG
ncbi:eukaryotic mitochondrial regulator protein-domain-containing protein [Chaetomium fimeti]|uniref:Eukaryotic mitochondrial regulator protein-domain-containing protein n=1 Tax=Chaetomium fimeti TaxID=1854472 RepID=A0AAE0HKB2_9PEZI|nr:eukaryotic mitochondrial regulator protein-domain-containing protein [Chaetomium fimeti]